MDVQRLRADTPGCSRVLHFNNAGASLQPRLVIEAVRRHLDREQEIGGYEAQAEAEQQIRNVYASCARLVNGKPNEIAVVENATRAFDMAFYAIPFRPGDVILTTVSEYASNFIAYLQIARRMGVEVRVIPDDERGQLSLAALREMLSPRVRLVSFAHVPTNNGLVQPAAEVGEIVHGSGALYLLDACQSVGQLPIDAGLIGCHILSGTGRKYLRGPRGIGFLWVRDDLIGDLEPPFLDLHAARWVSEDGYEVDPTAKRFENWESNIAAKLGLGAAVDYALATGAEAAWKRLRELAAALRDGLHRLAGVRVTDTGAVQGGIVTFTVDGVRPAVIRDGLRARGVNVAVSPAEYSILDMARRAPAGLIRASAHYYNSEDEVRRFLSELGNLVADVRS